MSKNEVGPSTRKFKVTQTRSIEVIAEYPSDAADIARYVFRGDPVPRNIPAWVDPARINIISLEVDEA